MNAPIPLHLTPGFPTLFTVGGCKGGVGKSMVSIALLDYLLRRDTPVLLIDTDTSNPDVWRLSLIHI